MQMRALCATALLAAGAFVTTADAASQVYAVDLRQSRFLSFPVDAPAQNVLSSSGVVNTYAMDFDSAATTLFAIENTGLAFGTVDLTNGAFTSIAPISGAAAGASFTGMTVDPTTETYYVSATPAGGVSAVEVLSPCSQYDTAQLCAAVTGANGVIFGGEPEAGT